MPWPGVCQSYVGWSAVPELVQLCLCGNGREWKETRDAEGLHVSGHISNSAFMTEMMTWALSLEEPVCGPSLVIDSFYLSLLCETTL